MKLGTEMESYSSLAMAIGMVAALLLIAGGVKLVLERETRLRGVLMIVAALVLVMNVMIWTV
jgi:high-affinity Fe2+/Pb2+ permease